MHSSQNTSELQFFDTLRYEMQCLQTATFPLVWPHVLRVAVIALFYFAKVCKQSITLDIADHIS